VRFGVESAFLSLQQGNLHRYFSNNFTEGKEKLPINGLIWMGESAFMREQIKQKLAAGFTCLKMKIGAIDFEEEVRILEEIRQVAPSEKLILRVDANGAFLPEEALEKLQVLSRFALHSIEQPIQPKQWEVMAELCKKSPIPIALDEELIGVTQAKEQAALIEKIQPAYVIFKPTLLGGFENTKKWIDLAQKNTIPWWITSALESNVGLSAICQFTATHVTDKTMHQGLGTGQLYTNNWESPLEVSAGHIQSVSSKGWDALFTL
jgi:L-alanine-DL-glutamate epimerase-like enolase superfamily enzyme